MCRCVCVHMCVWLCDPQVLPEGRPVGPGQCSPTGEGGGSACDTSCRQTGLSSTLHSQNLVHLCPYYFKRGDISSRLFQLCVWHRNPSKAPGAALALGLHTLAEPIVPVLLADEHEHHSDQSITPWCSETAERVLYVLYMLQGGEAQGWDEKCSTSYSKRSYPLCRELLGQVVR